MRSFAVMALYGALCMAGDSDVNSARVLQQASIEKQRVSVRIQESSVADRHPSLALSASRVLQSQPEFACERAPLEKIREIVETGARNSGLDTELVRAVVQKESGYDTCATSIKGARGLMQLMPSVRMQFGVTNAYDPEQNVAAGTRLLKQLLDQYGGDLARALGAYNAGPARVEQFGGVPPFPETTHYVDSILNDLATR